MRLVFDESNIHSTLDTQTNAIKNMLFLVLFSKIRTYSLVPGLALTDTLANCNKVEHDKI